MKRCIIICILIVLGMPVRVGAEGIVSDAQIAIIRDHCRYAQQQMKTTSTSDGVLRYNQAQQYDMLLTKLMTPFNNRLALNRIDSTLLVEDTVLYQKKINGFRTQYHLYGNTIEEAIAIDCQNRPLEFYQSLAVARDQRRQVGIIVNEINDVLKQYRQHVSDLMPKLAGGGQ